IHGNSVQHLTYQYTNGNPMPGLNYYRLKQVDIDGHCTYSEIKMVQHQQLSGSYHWFPNPSTGPIWMVADQPYDVRIYAVNGQLVGEWKGVQNQEFNLDTPGLYIINMYKNGILQSVQKLTIQK
ncbi:MAG TPA: T9SS type A sorting domain-containing protein, partial [Chitinophagaceae bacterium]|nr:T9SS type A sorting domain-containing protein [Chitinophagaceae bacterium]